MLKFNALNKHKRRAKFEVTDVTNINLDATFT